MENSCQFKFSVIIPVYDVEDYLEETLLSVIDQSIGFKKNIQIILINDGSPDNSELICLKYKEKYPNNIVYVRQENAGVSAARNTGMEYIQGEYVNFLDSDDKWSKNAFKDVYHFFRKHGDAIDIVAGRIKYFERREDYHVLDYKFEKDKIVDIKKDYDFIQLSMATTFVRAEALKGRRFDSRVRYGEDCLLINTILFDKCKYGVLRDSVYYYRMRYTGSSAMQNTLRTKSWYFESEELVFQRLIDLSKEKFGKAIQYIQYLVMYDMKWRLRAAIPDGLLTDEEKERYYRILHNILKEIDDYIIVKQKGCTSFHYMLAFNIKYQKDCRKDIVYDNGRITFHGQRLSHTARRRLLKLDFINIKKGVLEIMGQVDYWLDEDDYKLAFEDQKKNRYYIEEYFPVPYKTRTGVMGEYGHVRGYRISIPLKGVKKLRGIFEYKNGHTTYMILGYGKFCKLTHVMDNSYGLYGKYILSARNKTITIRKKSKKLYKKCERKYCLELLSKGKLSLLGYRLALRVLRKFHKKKIWLLSDRINMARDNGEALFKYLNTIDTGDVQVYFDIYKKCEDYKRMKQYGKVISHDSMRYRLYFLAADKIVSAHIDEYVINAFGADRDFMKNLYQFDTVFLQHGVTKDDLSGWVNKYNKNIGMFVTVSPMEYQSILDGDYFYSKDDVKLTGFPRFDYLTCSEKKKQVIFLPSWRKALANSIDVKTGERIYNPEFKNTEFFRFYNNLLQDERLLECMRKNGYTGKFCLHVNHMEQIGDYTGNDVFEIQRGNLDYQKEFVENALMLTDYSSVAFDFAYMKKSIVYAQFDRKEFFEGQAYDEGYFDYETDGFGPVCYDYESTVDALIHAIEQDCAIDEEYQKRIEKFYYKTDTNNCKRVYDAILAIGNIDEVD